MFLTIHAVELENASKVSQMHEGTRTLELQGPILPCALDELVRAPVKILVNDPQQLFMHDKSSNAEAQGLKLQRTTVVDAEDPGSHYLVRAMGFGEALHMVVWDIE